jgi:hypothetical protein
MSFWNSAKAILGEVAPTLGTALGGPVGGIAAKAITQALGLPAGSGEKEISSAITNASPEQLAALKKIEADFKVQMKELDIDVKRLEVQDRDSARKRQAAMGDHTPTILALMTMVSFFGYIGAVTFVPEARNADIGFINIAVGWLGGTASTVIAYYFGSSSGSDKKDQMLRKD